MHKVLRVLSGLAVPVLAAAVITYCDWAFEITGEIHPGFPFYELSIVPMLAALLAMSPHPVWVAGVVLAAVPGEPC